MYLFSFPLAISIEALSMSNAKSCWLSERGIGIGGVQTISGFKLNGYVYIR